jgi:hypothetical protein
VQLVPLRPGPRPGKVAIKDRLAAKPARVLVLEVLQFTPPSVMRDPCLSAIHTRGEPTPRTDRVPSSPPLTPCDPARPAQMTPTTLSQCCLPYRGYTVSASNPPLMARERIPNLLCASVRYVRGTHRVAHLDFLAASSGAALCFDLRPILSFRSIVLACQTQCFVCGVRVERWSGCSNREPTPRTADRLCQVSPSSLMQLAVLRCYARSRSRASFRLQLNVSGQAGPDALTVQLRC